jgi:hypothetical protein
MHQIRSDIEIAATAERVWGLLTDFRAYPSWNPFVRRISGEQTVGAQLDVTIQPDGGRAMSFKPKLLIFSPQKELRWKGHLLVPRVFDGEHYFQLSVTTAGGVRLEQGEIFSGLLVPLLAQPSMLAGTARGFAAMNQALKARAEAPQ